MEVQASVLWDYGDNWHPSLSELDAPGPHEVLMHVASAGLCHSDERTRRHPDARKPMIGGHEAPGIVEEVGSEVEDLEVGDHVVFSHVDIPMLLEMYQNGQHKLDELITKHYTLDQIAEGYQDMADGTILRGIVAINPE